MAHTPFMREQANNDTMVICIHGFWGSPCQFHFLADELFAQGYSVQAVLLPGHGSTGEAFARFGLEDWEGHVQQVIEAAARKYRHIWLIGHSMGGLLALQASLEATNPISGVVALAPPMGMRLCLRGIWNGARVVLSADEGQDERLQSYKKANSVGCTKLLTYPRWLRQGYDLQKLISKAKGFIPRIKVPVLIIRSEKDESVHKKSGQRLFEALTCAQKKLITLKDSWHAYYTPTEQEQIKDEIVRFLKGQMTIDQ